VGHPRLPVQLTLALLGGQAADLGRDVAGGPLTAPSGWTTTTSAPSAYSAQVPRPLRAEVVGGPSGRSTRRYEGAMRTPSRVTGWSPA
jgi:hypothetical protein